MHTELDDVTNGTHNQEANADGLGDLEKLLLVSCREFELAYASRDKRGCVW